MPRGAAADLLRAVAQAERFEVPRFYLFFVDLCSGEEKTWCSSECWSISTLVLLKKTLFFSKSFWIWNDFPGSPFLKRKLDSRGLKFPILVIGCDSRWSHEGMMTSKGSLDMSWTNNPGIHQLLLLVMIIPLVWNPFNGHINPYYWLSSLMIRSGGFKDFLFSPRSNLGFMIQEWRAYVFRCLLKPTN